MKDILIGVVLGLAIIAITNIWAKRVVDKHWDVIKPIIKKMFSLP